MTSTEEETEVQPDDAEYFEPGEEDDMTESEQEAMYEEIGDEAERGRGRRRAGTADEEAAAAPVAPPTRPTVRPPQRPAARKGGRR